MPEAEFTFGVSSGVNSVNHIHPSLLSQVSTRELDGKFTSRDTNWHPYEMPVLASGGLASYATVSAPISVSYFKMKQIQMEVKILTF